MTLRRRGFLRLIGAAAAAPLIPVGTAAAYSNAGYAAAIAHAKRFPLVSVGGMIKHLGLSKIEAEAIISEMSSEGLVGVINPTRPGTVRAASKIYTKDHWGIVRTSKPRKAVVRTQPEGQTPATGPADAMMAYLHDLCRAQGMTLSPRCFA